MLNLKSLIAAISQSSVSLAEEAPCPWPCPTEAEELNTWYPGHGSLCYGSIALLPAEQVGVFLPRVLCVSYLQ